MLGEENIDGYEGFTYLYDEIIRTNSEENKVTGKTPMLIDELESFYGFTIDWDVDRAEEKRLNYEASGGDNTFTTGYMLFELPEGWDRDNQNSSSGLHVYAPGGDSGASNCMIWMMEEYVSSDETVSAKELAGGKEEAEELIAEMMGIEVTDFDIESVDTCLGEAAKLSYTVTVEGETASCEMYYIPSDYQLFMMYAMKISDSEEDPFSVLADIMESGQVKQS